VQRALVVLDRFADLEIGLADASIVVLAERYRTRDVLTLDERHFRPLRTLDGHPFRLIPADS
jgi:predicted nucleic acid-binding protein